MKIALTDIRFYAYHGVLPQEREVGGEYRLSLEVECLDSIAACQEDRLEGTVNYAALLAIAQREMAVPSALLENVAWRIGDAIRREFSMVISATVALTKVNPPLGVPTAGATVTISL